jgi:hypothetical protein
MSREQITREQITREQITRELTPVCAALAHNIPCCSVRSTLSVKCACHVF